MVNMFHPETADAVLIFNRLLFVSCSLVTHVHSGLTCAVINYSNK